MAKSSVAVIDYGMGNLHSVASALSYVADDVEVLVTADPDVILAADRVLFPGVGGIRDCMAEILRLGVDQVVAEAAKTKPLLAICVGMQALMESSEENGGVDCLGMFAGKVRFFGDKLTDVKGEKLKVPHMGWNQVHQQGTHALWQNIAQDSRFYFVHSYFVQADNQALVSATTDYGVNFNASLHHENIFATQFHPEKSGDVGLQLLKNFLQWDGHS